MKVDKDKMSESEKTNIPEEARAKEEAFIPDVFPDEADAEDSVSEDSATEEATLLEARIIELTNDNAKLNDLIMRERAEFANSRKRNNQEMLQTEGRTAGKILQEILPAFDAFDQLLLAGHTGEKAMEKFLDGSKLIRKQLWQVFENLGVEEVNPLNMEFDPILMEALSMVEVDNVESDRVSQVYQKGYKFKDRVLRPARVAVEKPKSAGKKDVESQG